MTEGQLRKVQTNPHTPKTCVFFNVGQCNRGNSCSFKHVCWKCGMNHRYDQVHA